MNKHLLLQAIIESNLQSTTKSFLSSVLKNVNNSDLEKIKTEEDAAWAQRASQKDAKRQLEEDAAYDTFESPHFFKKVNNFGDEISRLTPDPDVLRSADDTDIDRLNKKSNLRKEILATPGRVDPKLGKVELDKATFMQQADDMYDDVSGRFLPFEIEQYSGDPRYALDVIDGPDEEDLLPQRYTRRIKNEEKQNNFNNLLDSIAKQYDNN